MWMWMIRFQRLRFDPTFPTPTLGSRNVVTGHLRAATWVEEMDAKNSLGLSSSMGILSVFFCELPENPEKIFKKKTFSL